MSKIDRCLRQGLRARILAVATIGAGFLVAPTAYAEEDDGPVQLAVEYNLDQFSVVSGGISQRSRHLDDLDIALDVDLEQMMNWSGTGLHLELSNTSGNVVYDIAGAAQGIDHSEIDAQRLRLYQAYVETEFASNNANLRVGFTDLSGEFHTAESSDVLINPSFGMSSEFAGSGAAAWPSTGFGARLRLAPSQKSYIQFATVNAHTGVPGDQGGADFSFDQGALVMGEVGWTGRGKVAVGFWRYTKERDDLFAVTTGGAPVTRPAWGAYGLLEQSLMTAVGGGRSATGFLRAGVSDGRTNVFQGSLQAGVLFEPAFRARPESKFSMAVSQAKFGKAYRQASSALGVPTTQAETILELTYSDQIAPHVRLQPDLQFVHRPSGTKLIKDAVVAGLRLNLAF